MSKRIIARPRAVNCAICGAEFITHHSQGKYCSEECRRQGWRASWRAYGERNRPARRAYHKDLYLRDPSKIAERVKRYRATPAGKQTQHAKDQRQRERWPDKIAARQATLVAKRAGKVCEQPCARCGCLDVEAHHPDYSRPLNVVWLCKPCHRAEHRRLNEERVAA